MDKIPTSTNIRKDKSVIYNGIEFSYEDSAIETPNDYVTCNIYLNVTITKGNSKYPSGTKIDKISIQSIIYFSNLDGVENRGILTEEETNDDYYEQLVEEAEKAKINKNLKLAGQLFSKASKLKNDSYDTYIEAGKCYKTVNYLESIKNFMSAITILLKEYRFGMAARYYDDIAQMYQDNEDEENSLLYYKEAAKYYTRDNKPTSADKCLEQVGFFLSNKNDFQEASEIFENIGLEKAKSQVGRFSTVKYFIKCLYCLMAMGKFDESILKMKDFKIRCPELIDSREFLLIENLIKYCKKRNGKKFDKILNEYDEITPLNVWECKILDKIKNNINNDV